MPSLNRAASDLILSRIEDVRRAGAREDLTLTSSSLLLLGPAGAGKTHLFTRLRRSAGRRAVFIHTRPQIGVEPGPRFVLRSIVESLKQPIAGDEQRQIDLVAGAVLAAHEGDRRFPLAKVEEARGLSADERRALLDRVVGRVEDRFSGVLSGFLFRLLEVPFADRQDRRALLTWLSGGEPSVVDLERLGAPGPLADIDLMSALATLGIAAAYGAPVVLVFDQLENLAEEEGKTSRIHAHARLVSDLRDTVRGLTIVQMALDAEWMTRIHPALHASDRDRLEETVLRLALPTPGERRELLERWREALPDEELTAPFPHPFQPAEVERWIQDRGMTPRMLMQACGEAYLTRLDTSHDGGTASIPPSEALPTPAKPDPGERLAAHWDEAIARARREIDEAYQQNCGVPADRLAGGLLAALGALLGGRAELPGDAAAALASRRCAAEASTSTSSSPSRPTTAPSPPPSVTPRRSPATTCSSASAPWRSLPRGKRSSAASPPSPPPPAPTFVPARSRGGGAPARARSVHHGRAVAGSLGRRRQRGPSADAVLRLGRAGPRLRHLGAPSKRSRPRRPAPDRRGRRRARSRARLAPAPAPPDPRAPRPLR